VPEPPKTGISIKITYLLTYLRALGMSTGLWRILNCRTGLLRGVLLSKVPTISSYGSISTLIDLFPYFPYLTTKIIKDDITYHHVAMCCWVIITLLFLLFSTSKTKRLGNEVWSRDKPGRARVWWTMSISLSSKSSLKRIVRFPHSLCKTGFTRMPHVQ